jgi:hypothetical protein
VWKKGSEMRECGDSAREVLPPPEKRLRSR